MIIRKFTSEEYSGKNLSVLVIVGHRGVGKTTLAKVVYNHRSVKQHFDRRLWLHVSVYFDEVRLIRDLLEALCEKRYEDVNLKELQSILGHTWKSNRVLLVLDDVWEDGRRDKWDELLTPLRTNDAKGNTILVTTRKSSVVTMTNATEQVNIGGLHDAAFWGLFKECAFGDAEHKGHRKLKDIGKKIAVKLNGFPLAAKCVGKLLKWKLHDEHWTRILENSEWKDQQEEFKPAADLRLIRHVSVITELAYYGQQDGSISSNECFMHDFARTFCTLPKTNLSTMMLFGAHDLTFASTFQQALGNIKAIRVLKMEMQLFLPESLMEIEFGNCEITGKQLSHLMLNLPRLKAVKNLHTEYCDMLQSIQDLDSLAFLKELEIYMCSRLTSVQVKSCTSLQRLSIQSCGALSKLDGSDSLTFLKEVSICVNSSLESVELCCCRELERLYIRECPALLSWQGFESFTGLKHLHVSKCPGFVSCWESAAKHFDIEANKNFSIPVRHLEIDDNNVLSMPILCQFTSLETLIISGINTRSDNVNILSDSQEAALLLLTSLKELVFFHFEHVHSLPSSIHRLQTLQRLKIMNCPAIVALPDGGLPLSLVEMDLQRCSIELKELCRSVSEMQKFRLYIKY
ncbi:hypothetical protein PR202_gb24790 [Eleusine coracana subsp. coracana]|uniref:NB-ARC domain-containing protein n=1 Tax=Eleusine coracana subsp. coracana TaxID=191504 RepID=A0AAV5FJZ0_ELECO|nr:hypothetical protein PR202_gb24790 [Eleusine coracana subsp. coracana]